MTHKRENKEDNIEISVKSPLPDSREAAELDFYFHFPDFMI